jgi:hypothetical protein
MSHINRVFDLFVPNMFPTITEEYVMEVFRKLDIGIVSRVDFKFKTDRNGKRYKSAYIFLNRWLDSTAADELQRKIETATFANPARVVYNGRYSWIILENKKTVEQFKAAPLVRQTCHADTYPDYEPLQPVLSRIPLQSYPTQDLHTERETYDFAQEDDTTLKTEVDNLRMENQDLSTSLAEVRQRNLALQEEIVQLHNVREVDHLHFTEEIMLLEQRIADLEKDKIE